MLARLYREGFEPSELQQVVSASFNFPHYQIYPGATIPKPVLNSCRLYAGCRQVRKQVSSRLILERRNDPSFDSALTN